MGILRSDENYRLVHCLVKTNKDLLTFFLPQSLSSPLTITELLEELLEVRAGPSSVYYYKCGAGGFSHFKFSYRWSITETMKATPDYILNTLGCSTN